MLIQSALDERHLELLRAVGFRSALIVPMLIGDRILGAMTLVSAESALVFDRVDTELAEQVASRAAVAIENSRLYSERSAIARTLQRNLLPEQLPEIPGYELASIYLPALETSLVGGDFYDVWPLGDSWMALVGDVTGKGIEAASLTALVRHTVRSASEFERSPARLLAFVDRTLKKRSTLSVCTAICIRLDNDEATFAAGGHPLPLRVNSDGVEELGVNGPLLGGFADVRWEDCAVRLAPGSALVAYTDGVTDACDESGDRFGSARLAETLDELSESAAVEMVEGLAARLAAFQAGVNTDDTAALVLRRPASPEDRP
jgi:serine phosphatase RsbU (regulator of sigma subunit)